MTYPLSSFSPGSTEPAATAADRVLWERAVACAWVLNSLIVELNQQKLPFTRLSSALQGLREQVAAAPLDEDTVSILETELQTALAELESVRALLQSGTDEVTQTLRTLWQRRTALRKK
ncbi:MAG: hypothetical protein HY710_14945 [Candidatus Latescibacteria bacterium]|nr:hypothetical protein [Candidatus Latescibacterota bacterium]